MTGQSKSENPYAIFGGNPYVAGCQNENKFIIENISDKSDVSKIEHNPITGQVLLINSIDHIIKEIKLRNIESGWHSMDPLAEKHYSISPYVYCLNNPVKYIDPLGMDTVHVLDQDTRPLDNGTAGQTYTADIFVEQNGIILGPYKGSSYPNSISNTDNNTDANTLNEGEHQYNNMSGHRNGTQKGLNIVDANGGRTAPGTDPKGNSVTMTTVNVHKGASDKGNATSRGSLGCITINPEEATSFFSNFDWSGKNENTGNSTGSIIIVRGGNADMTKRMLQEKQNW